MNFSVYTCQDTTTKKNTNEVFLNDEYRIATINTSHTYKCCTAKMCLVFEGSDDSCDVSIVGFRSCDVHNAFIVVVDILGAALLKADVIKLVYSSAFIRITT